MLSQADYECVHDGPHFSYSFYSSWSNIVGSVTGYIGVILFQTVMGKWDFRNVFWVTTIIRMIASLLDVVIVMRWNVAVGIPDEVRADDHTALVINFVCAFCVRCYRYLDQSLLFPCVVGHC